MKLSTSFKHCILLLLIFMFNTLQAGNGKITGKVTDKNTGEVLPAVNIVVTHAILSGGREVKLDAPLGGATDADGVYFIMNVPPGVYVVRASMVGYETAIVKKVKVDPDRTYDLDFQIASSSVEMGQIIVTAKNETIKKDVSGTQEVITTARIENMPMTRVDEFVGKMKGVTLVSGSDGNGLSVRGGSIRETAIKMDGISLQDPRSDNAYLAFNSTTIDQIQLVTGGFEAKYGGVRSGLLNVITKEGHRERYTVTLKADMAPANQRRYFGTDPYGNDSWIYKVFAGQYAFSGVPKGDTTVPQEFRSFKGWGVDPKTKRVKSGYQYLDSLQNWELWKIQHPQYKYGEKPDIYLEGSITGPFPGESVPILGEFAGRTTFLLGFKYEKTHFAFPLGPRDAYKDWNAQLKLTTQLNDNMKLSVNGIYGKIESNSGGRNTTYGGALVDRTSSFGFLTNSESSVNQQGALLGGSEGYLQMFNKSRYQYYDQRVFAGGAKFTNAIDRNSYYSIDAQVGYSDQSLKPFSMDTSKPESWVTFYSARAKKNYKFLRAPELGSPNGSTNPGNDLLDMFTIFGGLQRVDSSYSWVGELKGEYVNQLGKHNQFEAGFQARLEDMFVYSGTWLQGKVSFTPDLWQYYRATPLQIGLYVQDKLEFEGLVLNAGLRLDYFNPMREGFAAGFPADPDYRKLYDEIYQNLPGEWGGYQRWKAFREMLEDPAGWPRIENKVQVYLSPRLGVSFPITEQSKIYFNYGHFYQRPAASFLYNQVLDLSSVTVPTPDLKMPRTISYEFGYEQMIYEDFVFNITAYYKDIQNEPLARSYINYYRDNIINKYYPDAYSDVRGVEARFELPMSRFVSFYAMYDYMLQSWGQSGLANIYENKLDAKDERRSANLANSEPRPRANVNLNLHTPEDFGPDFIGVFPLGGWTANFLFEWRDGGRILWNPEEPEVKNRIYVDAVNYWNLDFRGGKTFQTPVGSVEFTITVKNLTNNKWLNTSNMTTAQYSAYKRSLKLPHLGGSDQFGQYKSDDGHINTGWWTAPIFLNPRRIILGVRVSI